MAKILVVDDNEDVIFMLKTMLENGGHEVVEAANGEECLKKLKADTPDLIIMDIIMPGDDGWAVCRRIKEMRPRISVPISMLSVRKDDEDVKKSLEYAHADAHLGKPVEMRELLDTVKRLLEKREDVQRS